MTVVGTGEGLALAVSQRCLGWGWPWQDLFLQDLSPSVLELEIFRCSCCQLVGILVPRVKQLFSLWCPQREHQCGDKRDCGFCIVCSNHKQRWKLIPVDGFQLCSSVPWRTNCFEFLKPWISFVNIIEKVTSVQKKNIWTHEARNCFLLSASWVTNPFW